MTQPSPVPRPAAQRLIDEGLVLVVEAASDANIRITSKTALRWCLSGVRGVRLESVKVGGRRMTSRPAFARFVAASQPPTAGQTAPGMDREAADRVLRAYGL